MCSDCIECFLEGGNGSCEIMDFEVNIEGQAEYKSSVELEDGEIAKSIQNRN